MKLRPGQTFPVKIEGVTYDIEVLSVESRMQVEAILEKTKDCKSVSDHYRAWLEIVKKHVRGWDLDEPFESIESRLLEEELSSLLEAVLDGNRPSQEEAKN